MFDKAYPCHKDYLFLNLPNATVAEDKKDFSTHCMLISGNLHVTFTFELVYYKINGINVTINCLKYVRFYRNPAS